MTLGLLVGRFGEFVRDQHDTPPAPQQESAFSPTESRIREAVDHHLIPLALLSRSDGKVDPSELDAMFDHAVAVMSKKGASLSESDRAALKEHIASFRPTLMQLDPALHRLEHESPEAVSSLLDAAKKVMMADGRLDPAEQKLLDEMRDELTKH
jgi:tellurite resistance protein